MRSPLESRIAALRGRVRRLLALHGLSRVVGALALAVVAAGLADYLLNLDAPVRAGLLFVLAIFLGWLSWRFIIAPLVVRFRDLDIALRIERRWPGLNDRLASTIQFLRARGQGNDFYLGSAALREAVVEQTLKETESIDFREVVDRRPVVRAALLGLLALAAGLAIVGLAPLSSRIAMARLFAPYGGTEWPKMTHLRVVAAPEKVARGEPFTLEVAVARGDRVPSSGKVTYTYENGDRVTEALRPDADGSFHGRIEAVTGPFDFTVAAGDDRTAPRHVDVVPPPALQDVTVELAPPPYTGLPRATLASGHTQLRAVEGTRVEVRATANKPIAQAVMFRGESPAKEAVRLDGARLSAKFTMVESLPFWFALRDRDGFKNQEVTRYEVHALKDEAPRVSIDDPISDRDVPANADVPVEITLEDDYGLHSARLLFRVADASGSEPTREQVRGLWSSETKPGEPYVKQHEVSYLWHLEDLKLSPGAVVTFYADALDYRDLPDFKPPKGPNRGKSRELRLRIVSPEQRDQLLNQQRQAIRDEIERVQAMQKSALTPVKEDRRMLERAGDLDKNGREGLKTAAMVQRQVEGRITNRADGLDRKIQQFLDDLKNFKVENPDAEKQMQGMKAGVGRIREQHLAPSEQGISRAAKALDDAADSKGNQDQAGEKGQDQDAQGNDAAKADKGNDQAASKKGQQGKPSAASKGQQQQGKAGESGQQNQGNDQPQAGDQGKQGDQGQQGKQDQQPQAGKASPAAEQAKKALAQAERHQQATVDELQKMLDGLGEFNTMREMVRDAENLLRAQDEALKQSGEAEKQPDMAGKPAEALSPTQRANLENMGARQGEVSKGLQNLLDKMDDTAKRTDEADPLSASALREAAAQARQQGTAGRMSEAAEKLAKNQMGSARAGQEQARKELKELVESLKNRRENELARLVRELKKAEADLKNLKDRQKQNLKNTRDARNIQDAAQRKAQLEKLAREQQQLRQEMERQLKRLEKLNAQNAARAGSRAASKMGQAQQDLDNGDNQQAEQDEDDALQDLQEAENEAQQARKEAEEQLALERLSRMEDVLVQLRGRQDKVVEETTSYDKARAEHDDKLTPAQRASVRGLSRVQDAIKEETDELVERLEGAPVFALTLKKAAESMDVASNRLRDLATDSDTQRAEKSASRRFTQLITALQPLKPKGAQQSPPGGNGPGGGQQAGNGDRIPTSAQIKMLKMLQQEVNTRTEELDEIKSRKKTLNDAQQAEIDRLQEEQGAIADLARDITQPKRPDGQED